MKKYILIFLLLCSVAFGVDVLTLWGGTGDTIGAKCAEAGGGGGSQAGVVGVSWN